MKLAYGPVPQGEPLSGDWRVMREPRMALVQLAVVLLGLLLAALVAWSWFALVPLRLMKVRPIGWLIVAMVLVVPMHELAHVAAQQDWGCKSVIGLWPAQGIFYALYEGTLSRNRMLRALALPWLVLTLAPLVWAGITGRASTMLMFLSSCNAMICGGDLFILGWLWRSVQSGAVIPIVGWRTFWK